MNIACSRVPKNLREGYGCFYHRLSIRPSPDSHSLSYWCILVCWRGTRTTLVPSNNIEACTTRSQLMARVPRSPSIANIASAQSFPRFSSQFFFFFFDVRIFRRTRLEDVSCARAELHLCESIQGKTQQVIVSHRFSILSRCDLLLVSVISLTFLTQRKCDSLKLHHHNYRIIHPWSVINYPDYSGR